MAVAAMKWGLCNSKFTSLNKMLFWTYIELLEHAQKYIRAKEGETDRHRSESKDPKKKTKKEGTSMEPSLACTEREAPHFRPSSKLKNFGPRYDSYTPLTTSRAQILMEIEGEDYLRRPQSMKIRVAFRNQRCYCRFYYDYGHNTKGCIELKNEIEDLIWRRYLEKYMWDLPT